MNAPHISALRSQLLLGMLLPIVLLAILFIAYLNLAPGWNEQQAWSEHGEVMARELATLTEPALTADDPAALEAAARSFLESSGALALSVRDSQDVVRVTLDRRKHSHGGHQGKGGTDKIHSFSAPILNRGRADPTAATAGVPPRYLGRTTIDFTTPIGNPGRQRLIRDGLLMTFATLIFGLLLMLGLSRKLLRPVQHLTQAMRQIEQGDLTPSVPAHSIGELGALETSFNSMAERLRHWRNELQHQIDQATGELIETMESLEIRNLELDLARKRALDASDIKSEFLTNMSHEMRTPLNGIIGYVNLLNKTELSSTQRDFVQTISKSTTSLLQIVNDVLDFTKLEDGKLPLDETYFRLRACFEDGIALLAPSAHEKGLELVILVYSDVPEELIGDPIRLRQILINLVGNAIKFTESGDIVVRVMLEEADEQRCTIRFSVTDTGIGIPRNLLSDLFEKFNRGNHITSRVYGGSGLGLSISKKLAEAMHGHIEVASEEGKGSTFSVDLRLQKAPSRRHPLKQSMRDHHILLYDTHKLSRLAAYHRLSTWKIVVESAVSAGEVMRRLQQRPQELDALLLGFTASDFYNGVAERLLEECKAATDIPVMVLISTSDRLHLEELRRLGADAALSKPVAGDILYRNLGNLLGLDLRSTAEAREPNRTTLAASTDLNGCSILVADDNRINRYLVSELLKGKGAKIQLAKDGREVMQQVSASRYDLILMDVHMPEVDGIEATRLIRAVKGDTSKVPIVALTADAAPANLQQILEAGMDGYLIKPVNEQQLWSTVQAAIAGQDLLSPELLPETGGEIFLATADLPVRDEKRALRATGGDAALAKRMYDLMLGDLPGEYAKIRQLQKKQDWTGVKETAHRLRGSTTYCGVPALDSCLGALETAVATPRPDEIEGIVEKLKSELERLLQSSRQHPDQPTGNQATA